MVSRVRVLGVTHVRPSETSNPLPADNENDDHTIKLSLMDTMFLPYKPLQHLFFYEGDDLPPFPALLRTLQSSLAATLAGHISVSKSGDIIIDCSRGAVSQGVRFVEAEYAGSTGDMRRLARDAEHDAEAYAQLAPAVEVSPLPVPALAVQVTRPEDMVGGRIGAVVVCVSMSHVVADGRALWEFIRAWAAATRGRSPALSEFPPPVFDRAVIKRHPKAEEVARTFLDIFAPALPTVKVFPSLETTLLRRRTYLLSASQIRSLKQRISLQTSNLADGDGAAAVGKPPTAYAAVASLVWTSSVRAKNAMNHADDDTYLLFAADCRARLRPPMPAAFFGNCVKLCFAKATVGELRDGGVGALACAALAVQEAIQEQLEDPLGDVDWWRERYRAVPPDRFVHIGSSQRFAAYETDFGWGKPSRVELAAVFGEVVALLGAPDGAVQVSVALDGGHMDDFEANFLSQLHSSA